MSITVRLLSSLEKVRSMQDLETSELTEVRLFRGEHFAFQVGCYSEETSFLRASVKVQSCTFTEVKTEKNGSATEGSEENGKVSAASGECGNAPENLTFKIYTVRSSVMDTPAFADHDDDILTDVPGMMPDLLEPQQDGWNVKLNSLKPAGAYWLDTVVPKELAPGEYRVTVALEVRTNLYEAPARIEKELKVTVLPDVLPEQSTIFTEWFHVDSIAEKHHTGVYTEAHWNMIEKYMKAAVYNGITMILVPAFTPPLDTMPGTHRLMTQLVGIEKSGENYTFDFDKLDRYMNLALSCGLRYFEISHLFSQWGAAYAPNIEVTENGEKTMLFGWHVKSTAPEYTAFLEQYLKALTDHLEARGLLEKCWFHISDEPGMDSISMYRTLHDLVKPLIKGRPIMDALSDLDFAKEGLIDCPVTGTNHIEPFLAEKYENQWAYVCCGQYKKVGNRFLCMPQYRNRIIGTQMFKFNIKGFLQWGFNFYRSQLSVYEIDPYMTTSADGSFPSGDAFIVYPGADGPLYSMRGLVFRDALQDVDILKLASEKLGRDYVVRVIDEEAGCDVRFDAYPRENGYILRLMDRLKKEIYNKVN